MTQEEILEPYYHQNKGGLQEWVEYEDAMKAMSEYAKQEAVGFAEWIRDEQYVQSKRTIKNWYQLPFTEDSQYFTTEQLYTLYQNSKK